LPPAAASLTPGPFSLLSPAPLVIILLGTLLCALALLALAIAEKGARSRLGGRLRGALLQLDSFSLAHVLQPHEAVVNLPTPLGGACTLLSLTVFFTCALLLIARYATANATAISTLDMLSASRNPFAQGRVEWAAPLPVPGGAALGDTSTLQARVLAPAGLGCTELAPGSLLSDGSGGTWSTAGTTPDCGDGRSLLQLSCHRCTLASARQLTLILPFTCQALHVELLAVDAMGELSIVTLADAHASAQGAAMLTTVSLAADPMASIWVDTISGGSKRGYRLIESASLALREVPSLGQGQALPKPVTLTLTLTPLQPTYSIVTVTQQQTIADLLTSIVGLVGVVSGFGVLFQMTERSLKAKGAGGACGGCPCLTQRRGSLAAASSEAFGGAAWQREAPAPPTACPGDTAPTTANPLVPHAVLVQGAEPGPFAGGGSGIPAGGKWLRYRDAEDTWYVSEESGSTSWEAPPGALIEDAPPRSE